MAERKTGADDAQEKKSIHAGHRQRLRERFRTAGLQSFSDHEILELLLTFAIPQKDVNPLAHELIARFGRLSHVLEADEEELLRVPGVGQNAAVLLNMMPQLMRSYRRSALGERPVIVNFADAKDYCTPLFLGAHQEHVYLICLDQSGRVLHPALLHTGTVDEVMLYPRLAVETALRHHAHAVLLAHNHPGGTAYASQADMETTLRLGAVFSQIGIRLVDHLIVADGHVHSMMRDRRFADLAPDADFSYLASKRARQEKPEMLRAEESEWLCIGADDLIAL